MAKFLKFAYQLRHHRFGGWALDRWAVTLAWGAAIVVLLLWLLRGLPELPWWHWFVLALLVTAGAGLLGLGVWAARRSYLLFMPEAGGCNPEPHALAPDDKVALRATGHFEVEGRAAFLVNLQAYWRSFATREHAIMAIHHPSRFLLLGQAPSERVGMWYIFISAEAIAEISPGRLAFGAAEGPALRLVYRRSVQSRDARKASQLIRQVAYLMFEDELMRERVWADCLADQNLR